MMALLAMPGIEDYDYDACCFGGARCKHQRLRSNVKGLANLRKSCKHHHDADEWKPMKVNGKWTYPTEEEAEFTAELSFAIAAELSIWACNSGRATLKLPRCTITAKESGDRCLHLRQPPESLRADAMAGVGLRLGLDPPTDEKEIPRLLSTADEGFVNPTHGSVYIGFGNCGA